MKKHTKLQKALALSLIFLTLFAVACKKKPKQTTMNGKVVNAAGNPVFNAMVKRTDNPNSGVATAKDGTFKYDKIDEGDYTIAITHDGFSNFSQAINHNSENQVSFTLTIKPGAPEVTNVTLDTTVHSDKIKITAVLTVRTPTPPNFIYKGFNSPTANIYGGGVGVGMGLYGFVSIGNNLYTYTWSDDVSNYAPRGKYYYDLIGVQNLSAEMSPNYDKEVSVVLN